MKDWQLLRQYVTQNSETAFSALVTRHVNLVHSTALRRVHDSQLAEEVTQAVFILMARKAHSFQENIVLPGWLYRTTRFVGASALRTEQRRRRREQEAFQMQQNASSDGTWRRLAPVLDEALERLGEDERNAVILRFFQEQPLREVGSMLGISEEAARKRVARSLEKLRVIFARRGFTISAAVLATALGNQGAEAAPAELGGTVAPSAFAHAGAVTTDLPDLVEEALRAWRRTRAKWVLALSAVGVVVCLVVIGSVTLRPRRSPPSAGMSDAVASVDEAPVSQMVSERSASPDAETQKTGGLRLQGNTEYYFFDFSTHRVITEHHDTFTLDLDRSGRWLMTVVSTMNTNACFVDAFDGTNNFNITYSSRMNKYPGSAEFMGATPYEEGNHHAAVSPGAYPFDAWPMERFTWFALASGSYLSQPESNRMPAPWRNGRTDMLAYAFTNDIKEASTWPNVPLEAEFVTSPSLVDGELRDLVVPSNVRVFWKDGEQGTNVLVAVSSNYIGPFVRGEDLGLSAPPLQTNQMDPRYLMVPRFTMKFLRGEEQGKSFPSVRPGQIAARYSVERSTNFSEVRIPLDYKLEVFWPGFGVNTTNRDTAEVYIGNVTNITGTDSNVGRPEIWGTITVDDFRSSHDPVHALNGRRYNITDRAWKE